MNYDEKQLFEAKTNKFILKKILIFNKIILFV